MTTLLWILGWTLVWPLAAILVDLLINRRTPERRIARLLAWYPRSWREQHAEPLTEVLRDAIDDGRDDFRLSLDVACEGVAERLRTPAPWRRVMAGFLTGLGWTMVLPQGIVALVLGGIGGVPAGGFVALHVGPAERWLVAGGMVGIGLLLVYRGMLLFAAEGRPRRRSASTA